MENPGLLCIFKQLFKFVLSMLQYYLINCFEHLLHLHQFSSKNHCVMMLTFFLILELLVLNKNTYFTISIFVSKIHQTCIKNCRSTFLHFWLFFNCYLAVPQPTLGHSWEKSLTNPMLTFVFYNQCFLQFWPEGHWEHCNKVWSLSWVECLWGF